MKILSFLLFFQTTHFLIGQVTFFSCNSDGAIDLSSTFDCKEKTYYGFPTFLDIAITPNKTLYGINGNLNKIDYLHNSFTQIGPVLDLNNRNISGTGLVALNDNFLFTDYNDSLFKIDVTTALAYPVGKIGYYCAGDLAFFNDTLYLAASLNHLIKITLNNTKSNIVSVKDVGTMNTEFSSVLSLFTTFLSCKSNEKGLFAIDGNKIYLINTQTANATYVCSFSNNINISYGATSSYEIDIDNVSEKLPNIFTPNKDGINDVLRFTTCTNIIKTTLYNRWGNIVFETEDTNHYWDGRTTSGEDCTDDIYFYIIETKEKTYKGFIQLIR